MTSVTYYVAQPFEFTSAGRLVPGAPQQVQTASEAVRRAEFMARKGGAIAFSRTGDLSSGDFDDAVILKSFGQVPEEVG